PLNSIRPMGWRDPRLTFAGTSKPSFRALSGPLATSPTRLSRRSPVSVARSELSSRYTAWRASAMQCVARSLRQLERLTSGIHLGLAGRWITIFAPLEPASKASTPWLLMYIAPGFPGDELLKRFGDLTKARDCTRTNSAEAGYRASRLIIA